MKEINEVWKPIPGYTDYEVSNLGRVRSFKRGGERVVKLSKHPQGYLQVNLSKNGKRKVIQVHRLVAMSFLGHVPNGHSSVVDHIDSNPTNNRLENIRIVSQRDNVTFGTLKRNTSSKYTGVSWYKPTKKWKAHININGKKKHLGYFTCEHEAGRAYQDKLKELNGIRN